MFCPVPARMVRWSPNRSRGRIPCTIDLSRPVGGGGALVGGAARSSPSPPAALFEISEPTEVLLDLLRLGLVQAGDGRVGRLALGPPDVGQRGPARGPLPTH